MDKIDRLIRRVDEEAAKKEEQFDSSYDSRTVLFLVILGVLYGTFIVSKACAVY